MITIIHGSHRHGIHWEIVTILKEYLEARDNEVRIIDLSEMEFNACCGTQVCQEGDCIYSDDQLFAVFESTVLPTDVIYIVTPTYFNMPPAKLKSFIDRTNALLPILEECNRTVYFGAWVSGEADLESIQTNSKLLKEYASIMGWQSVEDIMNTFLVADDFRPSLDQVIKIAESIESLVNEQ